MPAQSKLQKGFSLIELSIVLALVTTAILIFLKTTDTLERIGRSRFQNKAYHAAAKKIEELRNTSFANLPSSGSFTEEGLSGELTVQDYQGDSDIKQVTVEVFFPDPGGQKKVTIDTLMTQYGLNP